jgi:hypothetical protein
MNLKDMEGSSHGLIKTLSQHLSEGSSLVYLFEFLYNVELCPHNTRFLCNTGSVHVHLQTIYMQTKYKPTA